MATKVVLFDLDETIGHFVQLGIFWDSLIKYNQKYDNQQTFNILCDLFPEFFRPKILEIMRLLAKAKERTKNHPRKVCKIIIYTNNQGPKSWTNMIKIYIETKVGCQLFDQVIGSNGIEPLRTTFEKTYDDFITCAHLNNNECDVCFLDDRRHEKMIRDNVHYLKVKPYTHGMSFSTMIRRFMASSHLDESEYLAFYIAISEHAKRYKYNIKNKSAAEIDVDTIISKRIIQHLHNFLKD